MKPIPIGELEALLARTAKRASSSAPAKGRTRPAPAGEMNGLEARYAADLDILKAAGHVLEYWFEPMKLRLAANTTYKVDFLVQLADGTLECHEIKGDLWEDDARVKIKVAARMYPFVFRAFQARPKDEGGGWVVESFPGWT